MDSKYLLYTQDADLAVCSTVWQGFHVAWVREMLNSSTEVFTYRHLIIRTLRLISHLFIKHCLPKRGDINMTFWARFQHFLWGALACLMFFSVCPCSNFISHFSITIYSIAFRKETRGDSCTPPLTAGVSWNGDKSVQRVRVISGQRESGVITCGAAVQQRVRQRSWILTITPFIHRTCSLIPFHQAAAEQILSVSGCESTCQWSRLLISAHSWQININGKHCVTLKIKMVLQHHSPKHGRVGPLL